MLPHLQYIHKIYTSFVVICLFCICIISHYNIHAALQWCHNEYDGASNHQPHNWFTQPFIQAKIKQNIKAPCHWPLWGEIMYIMLLPLLYGIYITGSRYHYMWEIPFRRFIIKEKHVTLGVMCHASIHMIFLNFQHHNLLVYVFLIIMV